MMGERSQPGPFRRVLNGLEPKRCECCGRAIATLGARAAVVSDCLEEPARPVREAYLSRVTLLHEASPFLQSVSEEGRAYFYPTRSMRRHHVETSTKKDVRQTGIDPGFCQPRRHKLASQPEDVNGAGTTTLVDSKVIWHTCVDCRYSGCRGAVESEGSQTSARHCLGQKESRAHPIALPSIKRPGF